MCILAPTRGFLIFCEAAQGFLLLASDIKQLFTRQLGCFLRTLGSACTKIELVFTVVHLTQSSP